MLLPYVLFSLNLPRNQHKTNTASRLDYAYKTT